MAGLFPIQELSDDEFNYFRGIVYSETGINLSEMKRSLLQSRLLRRLRKLSLERYSQYREYLEENYSAELIDFINAITTNKTDFFREEQHFDFMTETVLPGLVAADKKRIRIWSAGCSTGEEPYSIAITIREFFGESSFPDIKILATDIDTQVIEKGMSGIYKEDSLQGMDTAVARKYFLKGTGSNAGLFRVKDSIRSLITFNRLNLLDFNYPMKGKFDIIFCRNVVIYFDKPTQKKLFEYMYEFLDDEGYLCVGHSENL
ncbi:MAG: CheR family methyltransferase, partial [Spirochaetota bacterium]